MSMVTKSACVVTYHQEVSTVNMYESRGIVGLREILDALYLHLQRSYGHQTREGSALTWEALTLNVT